MSSTDDSSSAAQAEMTQGTKEWYQARCGKITASNFGKLSGKARSGGGWTQTAVSYMTEVLAERMTGLPSEEIQSKYLDHGNEHEPTARQLYQWHRDSRESCTQVGFVDHPDIMFCGGSPDCLVGDAGVLEIKCPYTMRVHLANIENDGTSDKNYIWQMQGNLWITGRQWCDFVSFHPYVPEDIRFHVVRVERDEDIIEEIEDRVTRALEQIDVRAKKIVELVRISVEREKK